MNLPLVRQRPPDLTDRQRDALISLLADEDPAIYQTVRARILAYGDLAAGWLKTYRLHPDPLLRRRAQEIRDLFARQDSDTNFLGFCLRQGEEFDLEQGVWLFAQTQYPNVNIDAYRALLDSYAADLRERLNLQGLPESVLGTINDYLFDELGFKGNEQEYYDPENSYLNRVMDRRTGNPISLCQIYLFLARRLRLPIAGIGLPGHFICRYQSSKEELFIDVFNRGKLLTKADCVKFLIHTNHSLQEGHLGPVTPRRLLLRVCANLHQIYNQLELADESSRVQRYIVALAK